jgi:DNA polymerase I
MMELRAAAELAGDHAMRAAFERGEDLHSLTAAAIAGLDLGDVTKAQRQAAKPVNFGSIFGQGPAGLVMAAWENYRVEMTEAAARQAQGAFFRRYPALRAWMRMQADRARATGVVHTLLGRPLRSAWEKSGLRYTQSINHPVQGTCADVTLIALRTADAAISSMGAKIVHTLHDELIVEAAVADVPEAARRLTAAMVEAFAAVFPGAPTSGLVDGRIVESWADAKG